MSIPRATVYTAIDGEREYQDRIWPENSPTDPLPLTIGEEILLIERYVHLAREWWATSPRPETQSLHELRKIASIAVRCMETYGAPSRLPR